MATHSIIGVFSARPDGATSVALGLAARLSANRRVLAVDLALDRPEIAPLLNLDESAGIQQLAWRSRLAPVNSADLAGHLQRSDRLAVLAASCLSPARRHEITDPFVDDLITAATPGFDHVVVDLGRVRPELPASLARATLLWVVTPSPLGLAALERSTAQLDAADCRWRTAARVVLNRVTGRSWRTAGRFIEREYGMEAVGQVPMAADFWEAVEATHSLRPLSEPVLEPAGYLRVNGTGALLTRRAFGQLAEALNGSADSGAAGPWRHMPWRR